MANGIKKRALTTSWKARHQGDVCSCVCSENDQRRRITTFHWWVGRMRALWCHYVRNLNKSIINRRVKTTRGNEEPDPCRTRSGCLVHSLNADLPTFNAIYGRTVVKIGNKNRCAGSEKHLRSLGLYSIPNPGSEGGQAKWHQSLNRPNIRFRTLSSGRFLTGQFWIRSKTRR